MVYKNQAYPDCERWLISHLDVYAVESEVVKGLMYASDGKYIAVLRGRDVRICKLHDAADLIRDCQDDDVKNEMADIILDIKDMVFEQRKMVTPKERYDGNRKKAVDKNC